MKTQKGPNYKGDVCWLAASPLTGRLEEVDPEGEFSPGEKILKLFYCASQDRYVSVPGASLFKVAPDGQWVEERDE